MRRRLIEALTYPRLFVLQNMNLDECPQDGRFEGSCEQCRNCDLGQECHWLSCLNNFDDLANKPIHTIHASLLYSINLIGAYSEQQHHDPALCTCEACSWTRRAQALSREFSSKFTWSFIADGSASPRP